MSCAEFDLTPFSSWSILAIFESPFPIGVSSISVWRYGIASCHFSFEALWLLYFDQFVYLS